MIENKEFREILKKYPDDAIICIGVKYNQELTAFWNIEHEGIKLRANDKDFKVIILQNDELSEEYEHLLNGGDVE